MRTVLLFLSLCFALNMQAYTKIGITFHRTGTEASSVTATVVDQEGRAISGATASVTSSVAFKSTASAVTADMLCFNVNGNTSPTITLTVALSGLKESITFSEVGVDLHALNGNSGYQSNSDGKARQWNVALQQNGNAFATLSNFDAAAGVGETGSVHKFWSLAGTETTASGNLTLQFTITAGSSNVGCFIGLTDITIGGSSRIEPTTGPGPEPSEFGGADNYYHIVWHNNAGSYLTAKNGMLQVEGQSNMAMQYWQFLPAPTAGCYYIQNATTGQYIEACKTSANNTYYIKTTDTPVEYYISQEAAVGGAYRLTSTNCSNYSDTSKSPVGLNKDGASSYVITWGAATSHTGSYWDINPTEYDYDVEGVAALKRHTAFARSAQVYFMPCGTFLATYSARSLKVTGEGAQKELDYPCSTWGGSSSSVGTANTSSWWTLYTTDKGEVARGKAIEVVVTLAAKPAAGYLAQACFDWNHDGEFEDVQTLSTFSSREIRFTTTVPADAALGESRMRFRLTANGEQGPDEDVAQGQILDCMLFTVEPQEATITVRTNDPDRGAAYYEAASQAAVAEAVGDAHFLCWLEGKKVVSTEACYAVGTDRPHTLIAVFSVNTTNERPNGIHTATAADTPYAAPLYFDLTGRQVSTPTKGQTYIRKDSPRQGEVILY